MAEPDKFYVGVVDLFAIVLPGAVVTYAARIHPQVESWLFPAQASEPHAWSEAEGWAVFLVVSYITGHFIFLLGAPFDNVIYDRLRRATPWSQIRRAAAGKAPAWRITKWLARHLFGKDSDIAIQRILELKSQRIPDQDGVPAINAFQWAKARLAIGCPAGLAEVQRHEADSKFFRSFSVVLLAAVIMCAVRAGEPSFGWMPCAASVLVLVLSLWRYIERRFKSTQLAYWHVLTLDTQPAAAAPAAKDEA